MSNLSSLWFQYLWVGIFFATTGFSQTPQPEEVPKAPLTSPGAPTSETRDSVPVPAPAPPAPSQPPLPEVQIDIPDPPQNQVLDLYGILKVEEKAELSERLIALAKEKRLVIYLYTFPTVPKEPIKNVIIALREKWLDQVPLAGGIFIVPDEKRQLFCVIGGSESRQYPISLLNQKGNNAALASKNAIIPPENGVPAQELVRIATRERLLTAAQKLLEEMAELRHTTVPEDALKISVVPKSRALMLFFIIWKKIEKVMTSLIALVTLSLFAFFALVLWLRVLLKSHRKRYFPMVESRYRFDGIYSGGNNAYINYTGKRTQKRMEKSQDESHDES